MLTLGDPDVADELERRFSYEGFRAVRPRFRADGQRPSRSGIAYSSVWFPKQAARARPSGSSARATPVPRLTSHGRARSAAARLTAGRSLEGLEGWRHAAMYAGGAGR